MRKSIEGFLKEVALQLEMDGNRVGTQPPSQSHTRSVNGPQHSGRHIYSIFAKTNCPGAAGCFCEEKMHHSFQGSHQVARGTEGRPSPGSRRPRHTTGA